MRRVFLYTVGPGSALFERYGHTLLCTRDTEGDEERGTCTDYGVSNATSGFDLVWGTLRGRPTFVATGVTEQLALATFRGQGRAIDRQELPLDETAATTLADNLSSQVASSWSYAYHPRESNCASHPRDRIDAAFGGKLHAEALARPLPVDPDLASYRSQFEAGLSGHVLELGIGALIAGTPADPIPDAWQTMYQPERLRDGVTAYLGAPATSVATRVDHPLPTSPSIGRGALLVLGVAAYALARRMHRFSWALAALVVVLGVPALLLDLLALVSVWPEFSHNWVLLLLWPTDLALPWLRERSLLAYAKVRMAVAAMLAAAELVSVIHQPILPVALFAALPMLGIVLAHRARDLRNRVAAETAAAPAL